MQRRGENILANFQKILSDVIRENLKNGGIEVKYYSWSQIRLKKGAQVFGIYICGHISL